MFVAAWNDKFLYFSNHATTRVESKHGKVKVILRFNTIRFADINFIYHEVVNLRETVIHSSLGHSKIVIRHRYNIPHFTNLNKRISLHTLDILFEEYKRFVDAKGYEICECQLRTSYMLPCSHEQLVYMNKGYPIPLEAIDRFKRKLNLSPYASLGDDALDVGLKLHENEWPIVRYDLMEELRIYYDQYVVMFGTQECDNVKKSLDFFETDVRHSKNGRVCQRLVYSLLHDTMSFSTL
ncbi:hypothetical protein Tco_0298299 [Tanacetum coccineum]